MTFFRLGILAAATTLSSCNIVTTAPAPADFKLSAEALNLKYHAKLKTGDVRLYAEKIETTLDESGQKTHLATGGALLVKDTEPPIQAQAPSISVTPEYAEARGKATVQKADRLYIGEDDTAKIRINDTEITLEGPVIIREVASEEKPTKKAEGKAESKADAKKTEEDAPKKETPEATKPAAKPEAAKEKPKTVTEDKPKTATKPKAESAPAKPTPPPADKPKTATPVDRKRLLNLMREPTER